MPRWIQAVAIAAAVLTPAATRGQTSIDLDADEDCRVVRISPQGRLAARAQERRSAMAEKRSRSGSAKAHASTGSSSSASSSVGVSASSGAPGRAFASTSSRTDGRGRTVTTTQDEEGCTVVIDERGARGARK